MASLQNIPFNSDTFLHQRNLLFLMKEDLDLVYKHLDNFRVACRRVDRFNQVTRRMLHDDNRNDHAYAVTNGQLDSDRLINEFVKFERNYRILRNKLCKFDRKMRDINLYDKLHDLYQNCIVVGESIEVEDSVDSFGIEPAVIYEDSPVDNFVDIEDTPDNDLADVEYTQVNDFVGIEDTLDNDFADVEYTQVNDFVGIEDTLDNHFADVEYTPDDNFVSIEDTSVDFFLDQMTDVKSAMFQCDQCDKLCKTQEILIMHKRMHEKMDERESRYKCSIDGCDFHTNCFSNLDTHKTAVHTGNPQTIAIDELERSSFQCSQCDKSFKSFVSLSVHKRIHSRIPRIKCCWSGCEFRARCFGDLKAHKSAVHVQYDDHRKNHRTKKINTDELPFHCLQCGKSFKREYNLNQHQLLRCVH